MNYNIPFVGLKRQYKQIKIEIKEAILAVLEDMQLIGGQYVEEFSDNFKEKYKVKHVIPVANGTDALYIALKSLGIQKGDEVITTACSWISTLNVILAANATPVFIDINEQYLIDESKIKASINERTRLIMPVHLYGQMCNMKEIQRIADQYKIPIIEDCAQSHFSEFDSIVAGCYGDIGTFSFYPTKNLNAYGDAGCIITNNDQLVDKLKSYANNGESIKYHYVQQGINSRMDAIQAAILNVKLKYIDQWTQKRIDIASLYFEKLNHVTQIKLPKLYTRYQSKHVFYLFVINCERRDELREFLMCRGIQTMVHYPISLPFESFYQSLYGQTKIENFPNAYNIQDKILSLPIYPELREDEIDYICDSIKLFYT